MLALGSYQGIVVVDDDDRYRGVIMSADTYSGLIESPSEAASIMRLTRHNDTFLKPSMNVKSAMEHFDRPEAELLAVVSDDAHRTHDAATPKSLIRQPKESCDAA
jgi:chloride channel protein, CIC family